MFFSVITKNLSWKVLTKNLVAFNAMGLRMKNFNIYGGSLKNLIFRGGSLKTNILGELPKNGGTWIIFRFKGGLGQKGQSGVFEEGN